jgi:uncharacterized membrane protein
MRKKSLITALLVLAALGIADSAYLSETAITGSKLVCNIKGLDGCNIVAQSVYSHLLGIPLAFYGVAFYGAMFILACLALTVPRRFVHDVLAAIGILGLLASICFEAIQLFLIKALCVYCLGSAAISFFACIVSILLWRTFRADTKASTGAATSYEALNS